MDGHIDQEFETKFSLLFPIRLSTNTKYPPEVKYKPILVKDKDKLPSRLI
jgi:hypothetical protein